MSIEVRVPDIGDFDAVEVIEIFVAPGDTVAAEAPVLLLESDKATMEVPSPEAGTVAELKVAVGDKVAAGDLIALLDAAGAADPVPSSAGAGADPGDSGAAQPSQRDTAPSAASPPAEGGTRPRAEGPAPAPTRQEAPEPPARSPAAAVAEPAPPLAAAGPPHASPSVRLFARELGVDLSRVNGSGRKGRILREDVQGFVKQALKAPSAPAAPAGAGLPQMPAVDFSRFGPTETRPLSRIRKLSAKNLHRNWVVVPHVTQFESADITELDEFRRSESARGGVKLTLLPFLLKAAAVALRRYPDFNSSLDETGENLILKQYTHIGFAADTENGLVVPVIRDVDRRSVTDLAKEAAALAAKARDGKLSPAEMSGGCFSISSLGGIGGSHFTPIVNAPEVAILGVSRAERRPVWDGEAFQPRLMLPLSLSYDHRVIDGAAAARFVVTFAELLTDPRRLLL